LTPFEDFQQVYDNMNTAEKLVPQDTAGFRGALGQAYVIGGGGASAAHARNEL
jgi:hypothetical protein